MHDPIFPPPGYFVGLHPAWQAIDNSLASRAVACIASSAGVITLGYSGINAAMQGSLLTPYTALLFGSAAVGFFAPALADMHFAAAETLAKASFPSTYEQIKPSIHASLKGISRISLFAGAFLAICAMGFTSQSIPYSKEIFGIAAAGMCLIGAGRGRSLALDVQQKIYESPRLTPS